MKKLHFILIIITVLALGLASCQGLPTQVEPIPAEELQTLVAGTLTAVAFDVGQTQTAAVPPTETATPTETVPPPTETSAPPTITPTRDLVTITLNGDTNCRRGASTIFPLITTFKAGSVVEVIAVNPAGDYYYVKAAESPTGGCWVWNQFSTLQGDIAALPVYTPVPTPLPTATNTPPPRAVYTVAYVGLTKCGTGWATNFKITNTGVLTLSSIRIRNYLEGVATPYVHTSNSFIQWSGGTKYAVLDQIGPGGSMIVSTCDPGEFPSNPTDKTVKSEILICPSDNLKGSCTSTNLEFIPH